MHFFVFVDQCFELAQVSTRLTEEFPLLCCRNGIKCKKSDPYRRAFHKLYISIELIVFALRERGL